METKDQLWDLYMSNWDALCDAMEPIVVDDAYKTKPSFPLLLSPNTEDYDQADIKVMIFGQETNKWNGIFNPDGLEETIERASDEYNWFFYNGARKYRSPFWNGFWLFTRMFNRKFPDKKIGYLWDNIIKIGKADEKGTPLAYIYDIELQHFAMVKEEIEILKPQVILFLTGPDYDRRIKDKLGKLTFEPFSSYNERELAKLTLPNVDYAYRMYHPNYTYRQGKGVTEAFYQAIIDDIEFK